MRKGQQLLDQCKIWPFDAPGLDSQLRVGARVKRLPVRPIFADAQVSGKEREKENSGEDF